MEIQRDGEFLENIAERLSTDVISEGIVDQGEYVSGKDLVRVNLPKESKTRYYGEKAADEGNLEKIEQYIEPVGYKVDFSKSKSKLLGTTSDASVYFVDLSLIQLLSQGNPMAKIPGKHNYEIFAVGDSKMKSELKESMKKAVTD